MATSHYFDLNIEQILEGWEAPHAVRELIANALDEHTLSRVKRNIEITRDEHKVWHIRDWGRGLRAEHLTQKENQEKIRNQGKVIGKFGVGLKDALATLDRRSIRILLVSRHCEIELERRPKHGFTNVTTLHALIKPAANPTFVGTDIQLYGLSSEDMLTAKSFFLRFGDEEVLAQTEYGQILRRAPNQKGRIYVAGLRVAEEERFAFSYNITSLTAAMRKALNRERTNVGRGAYAERVKAMLLASSSEMVAQLLAEDLTGIALGTNRDEVGWTEVAMHACRILSANRKVVFVTASQRTSNPDSINHAIGDGYQIVTIPDKLNGQLQTLRDTDDRPVRHLLVYEQELAASYQYTFVHPSELNDQERAVYKEMRRIVALAGGMPRVVRQVRIAERMRPGSSMWDVMGLWEPLHGRIIVKRSELASMRRFASILLHEMAHARTRADDITREFESGLSDLLGIVASHALASGTIPSPAQSCTGKTT